MGYKLVPGPLITRQDIANGAVSQQPRKFGELKGKIRTARVFFYFPSANVPVGMPHALGKTPTAFRVVSVSRDGVPGVIYAPVRYETGGTKTKTDHVYNFSRNYVVLACETANTWAEVEIS